MQSQRFSLSFIYGLDLQFVPWKKLGKMAVKSVSPFKSDLCGMVSEISKYWKSPITKEFIRIQLSFSCMVLQLEFTLLSAFVFVLLNYWHKLSVHSFIKCSKCTKGTNVRIILRAKGLIVWSCQEKLLSTQYRHVQNRSNNVFSCCVVSPCSGHFIEEIFLVFFHRFLCTQKFKKLV